jgi:hypothetical protein
MPAIEQKFRVQAPVEVPKPVSFVTFCLVSYSPQGGWLVFLRSDSVRHKLPLRAAYFRQVLPLGRGFPTRGVLRLIRLPIGIRRAFPFTVLLRLPIRLSSLTLRFPLSPVSRFPLPCLNSGLPYVGPSHRQELMGPPKFFDVSLPACHGLRTPADLHAQAIPGVSCGLRAR